MVQVYGIKNCDTMKKAFQWLDKHKIEYAFHDYKKEGIDTATLQHWMKKIPTDKLINTKGITWKKQTEEDKASIGNSSKAIALMMQNTSMIKRPLVVMGKDDYLLGFDEVEWKKRF
jgi:arsenate reductase